MTHGSLTGGCLTYASDEKVQCVNITQGHCFLIRLTTAVFSQQLLLAIKNHEKIRKHSYHARRTFHKGKTTTSGAIKA